MNFKPVLCWEAAWYNICHNTHSLTLAHTIQYACRERQRAGQQVCFMLQLMKPHPFLTTVLTLKLSSSLPFFPCCVSLTT